MIAVAQHEDGRDGMVWSEGLQEIKYLKKKHFHLILSE